jgi:hypothetical protein
MPTDRATEIGPLRIEVVEPLRAIRYVVSENDHGLTADVTFRARTEAIEEPRQQIVRNNVPMMDYTRLTQWGTWQGTITLPTGVADRYVYLADIVPWVQGWMTTPASNFRRRRARPGRPSRCASSPSRRRRRRWWSP